MLEGVLLHSDSMLKPGQQLPPLPIRWQGNDQLTTALRGQATVLFFACASNCPDCLPLFRILSGSKELEYWGIRTLWVETAGREETIEPGLLDLEGRCEALLHGNRKPTLALLNAYQELKAVLTLGEHALPSLAECEGAITAALLASPG